MNLMHKLGAKEGMERTWERTKMAACGAVWCFGVWSKKANAKICLACGAHNLYF